jgi:multicomponent Na+:H+ antiporter subunit G
LDAASASLLAAGCFVAITSAVGMLRMPDFFSRIHPAGKADTLAQLCIFAALFLQAAFGEDRNLHVGIKLLLISGFLFLTTPSSTHAIAQAAHKDGLEPWRRPESDSETAPAEHPEEPEAESETAPDEHPEEPEAESTTGGEPTP